MSLLRKLLKKVGQLADVKLLPSEVSNGLGSGPLAPVLVGATSMLAVSLLELGVELGAAMSVATSEVVAAAAALVVADDWPSEADEDEGVLLEGAIAVVESNT